MSSGPRLLIVDDDPIQRAVARIALESAGWTVDEAEDGVAAQRAIASTRYAVVLLDIVMPGDDGFAIARAIRADRAGDPAVPILAFTSLSGDDVLRRAIAAGMDGHVVKPTPAATLIARLARWWPASRSPTRARLAAAFGAEQVAALEAGFGAQLVAALADLDAPDIAATAHRIAGVAGTLGFAEVHETWLALSEQQPDAREAAVRAARRTLRLLAPACAGLSRLP